MRLTHNNEKAWQFVELFANSFYQAHSNFLMPLLIMSCNAWLDANKWEKSEVEVKKVHSDVLKSFYHEVIFAVVYLCGGWNAMREFTQLLCGGWNAMREFTQLHREYQTDNYGNV
jgi:hypothetical protein